MRCRECESLLWSYVDGELAEGQRQTVEGHLAGCPRCALALERLRAFPLRLGHLTAVAPPPDFTTRLMRRIEPLPPPRELAGLASTQGYGPLRGPMGAFLALASAAAAVLIGLFSTSALALLTGQQVASSFANAKFPQSFSIAQVLSLAWLGSVLLLLSWPVMAALGGMLAVLSLLWFRSVAPRRAPGRRR